MKLLLDENLSPRLTALLTDIFPESEHVHECNLGSASDIAIWEYAKTHGFVIVSKNSDFFERSVLYGVPPKVIWVRAGNCSTTEMQSYWDSASKQFVPLSKTTQKPAFS